MRIMDTASAKWNWMSFQVDWWLKIGNFINFQHTPQYFSHILTFSGILLSGLLNNGSRNLLNRHMYKLYCIFLQPLFSFNDIMVEDSHSWISTMERYRGGLGKTGQEDKEGENVRLQQQWMELCLGMGDELDGLELVSVGFSEQTKVENIIVDDCCRPPDEEEIPEAFCRELE